LQTPAIDIHRVHVVSESPFVELLSFHSCIFLQVCDYRCGSGRYGDLNCNWRGMGRTCRLCFGDPLAARVADDISKAHGSRVILCNTHEPPSDNDSHRELISEDTDSAADTGLVVDDEDDPAAMPYTGDVARGELCAFVRGYAQMLPEISGTVSSILAFMPGMRVGIATTPGDFRAFNKCELSLEISR